MKHTFLIALTMCLGLTLASQETIDLVTLSGRYGFPSSYDSIYSGKATEYGFLASVVAPVTFSKKSIWYNKVDYLYWHVSDNETMPPDIANPINIHGIILRTGIIQKFSNGGSIQLLFAPRLMSDFRNVTGKHFQLGGIAMYEKVFSSKLTMGFGAMYNQECFGPYLVPLINLNWKISDRWSITGLLPVYAKINFKVNDGITVGFSHFGLTTSYRLGDSNYEGDYIERKSIDETLFGRFRMAKNIYIEGRFGYSLGRSYKQFESDQTVDFAIPLVTFGDDRTQKNVAFHDGWLAVVRLVYNIPIPE